MPWTFYLERSEDHRRLGGWGGALEACRKLGRCGRAQLEDCRRGLGSDWRLGGCGRVRDGRGGRNAAGGLGVERYRRFGGRLKRLRVKRLRRSLGLNVLDEESAVDVHRVDGAGRPIDRDGLGAWVGARVSKLEGLGDQLGL